MLELIQATLTENNLIPLISIPVGVLATWYFVEKL